MSHRDFGNQRFKTGVVRETVTDKVYEQEGYLFVDTPGTDAKETDTRISAQALKKSDIIPFTHLMRTGELNKTELEFLEEVRQASINQTGFENKLIFVLTHLDGKEEDQKLIEKK